MDSKKTDDPTAADPLGAGDSLEFKDDSDSTAGGTTVVQAGHARDPVPAGPAKKPRLVKRLWRRFNIYMLAFIFLLIIASAGVVVLYVKNRSNTDAAQGNLTQQNLPASALQDLANDGVQVGDPKQVLNIQSNAVFAGAVLVKGELQVAGGLRIGSGSLALPEVNVGGSATINQLQAQSLGVANAAQVGEMSIQRNLSVSGNGTFNGSISTPQLSVGRLQLNGDLNINRHLVAGGVTPGRANGGALGGGGTSSVSGSDTAGTISINTGSSPAAGCFLTVTFSNAFAAAPAVIITPVGSAAAGLSYYTNRGASNFSVCSTTPAPANSTFGFDYIVIE